MTTGKFRMTHGICTFGLQYISVSIGQRGLAFCFIYLYFLVVLGFELRP
jgi:hypothetical protein